MYRILLFINLFTLEFHQILHRLFLIIFHRSPQTRSPYRNPLYSPNYHPHHTPLSNHHPKQEKRPSLSPHYPHKSTGSLPQEIKSRRAKSERLDNCTRKKGASLEGALARLRTAGTQREIRNGKMARGDFNLHRPPRPRRPRLPQ